MGGAWKHVADKLRQSVQRLSSKQIVLGSDVYGAGSANGALLIHRHCYRTHQIQPWHTNAYWVPKHARLFSSGAVESAEHGSSNPASTVSGSRRGGFKQYFLLLPPALAAFLGVWQVGRRQEKIGMLEQRRSQEKEASEDVFTLLGQHDAERKKTKEDHVSSETNTTSLPEYKRVHATGVFDNEKSIFIGPRPRSTMGVTESGYFMVTPMRQNGRAIMVVRGWVPADWKFSNIPKDDSQATIHGVIRPSENPSVFVPKNTPEKRDWYFIDVPHLANAMGLPDATPLVEVVTPEEDTIQSGGKVNPTAMDILGGRTTIRTVNEEKDKESYPLAKSEGDLRHFSVMPRDHLNYALTWFSLSAATSALAYKVIKGRGR
mmetsp:Transcript_272/g.623  ORF Transcript_272/g.623 Transcript_272/m.623 type:complete len:375 (-) Transcript_272:746-1870(-)